MHTADYWLCHATGGVVLPLPITAYTVVMSSTAHPPHIRLGGDAAQLPPDCVLAQFVLFYTADGCYATGYEQLQLRRCATDTEARACEQCGVVYVGPLVYAARLVFTQVQRAFALLRGVPRPSLAHPAARADTPPLWGSAVYVRWLVQQLAQTPPGKVAMVPLLHGPDGQPSESPHPRHVIHTECMSPLRVQRIGTGAYVPHAPTHVADAAAEPTAPLYPIDVETLGVVAAAYAHDRAVQTRIWAFVLRRLVATAAVHPLHWLYWCSQQALDAYLQPWSTVCERTPLFAVTDGVLRRAMAIRHRIRQFSGVVANACCAEARSGVPHPLAVYMRQVHSIATVMWAETPLLPPPMPLQQYEQTATALQHVVEIEDLLPARGAPVAPCMQRIAATACRDGRIAYADRLLLVSVLQRAGVDAQRATAVLVSAARRTPALRTEYAAAVRGMYARPLQYVPGCTAARARGCCPFSATAMCMAQAGVAPGTTQRWNALECTAALVQMRGSRKQQAADVAAVVAATTS